MRREPTCVSSPRSRSPFKHDVGLDGLQGYTGPICDLHTPSTSTTQMHAAKPTAPRKRNRKRKRRQASSSSSSDSLDSSSGESEVPKKTHFKAAPPIKPSPSPSLSSSSSSSSDSEGGDDGDASAVIPQRTDSGPVAKARDQPRSPSPSPPPTDAPPFLPPEGSSSRAQDEQALRNRFRQFWMASVADGFADDLEKIRQVRVSSTSHPSRLSQT